MKAIICTRYGSPEVLKLSEVEKPVPKNNEVCIRIKATSVTASDCIVRGFKLPRWHLRGILMGFVLGFKKPRNPILGMVLAGEIESCGKKVQLFEKGDPVFAWTIGGSLKIKFGTYAEYICLPENGIISEKPVNLSYEEAVAIPYGGLIALHYLDKLGIRKLAGEEKDTRKMMVYGASGAIGTAAVQIAKSYGVKVTGVCSTDNIELVRSLGAEGVIDYTKDQTLKEGDSYDFILDAVGKWKSSDFKEQCKKALTSKGKYISVDDGSPVETLESLKLLRDLAESGKLKPVIDCIYPLEQMVEAHRYVDKGHKKGNVVITV